MNLNNTTYTQLDNIIKFATSCVYKDQILADSKETEESAINATSYMLAYSRSDDLSDEQRQIVINAYEEKNEYYKYLKDAYNVEPYIARTKEDFELLYFPEHQVQVNQYLFNFVSIYGEVRRAFYRTSYTNTMEDLPNYRQLCLATMNLSSIVRMMSSWMTNYFDIDMMDDEMVDTFMTSFGIYQFKKLPSQYKRNIAKNLNLLIKNKGSDQVILDILDIFDFKDIDVYKYYLVNNSTDLADENAGYTIKQNPRFLSHNIKIKSLQDAIKKNEYNVHDIKEIVGNDDYWHVDNEDILNKDFDFLLTKYFSIELSKEISQKAIETTYFINLLEYIRINYTLRETLNLRLSKFPNQEVSLYDIILLLQVLVNISHSDSLLTHSSQVLKGVDYSIPNRNFSSSYKDLNIPIKYQVRSLPTKGNIDISLVQEIHLHNQEALNYIKERIRSEKNYKMYKRLLAYYRKQFFDSFNNSLAIKASNYLEYFQYRNKDIYDFIISIGNISEEEQKLYTIEENIIYLNDAINAYVNNVELQFSSINNDNVTKYLRHIINVFKSFTISLRKLNSIIKIEENLEFRLLDEASYNRISLDVNTYKMQFMDYVNSYINLDMNDRLFMIDLHKVVQSISPNDRLRLLDKIQKMNSDLVVPENLRFNDKHLISYLVSFIDNLRLRDRLSFVHWITYIKERFKLNDIHFTFSLRNELDNLSLHENPILESNTNLSDSIGLFDSFTIINNS